MLTGEQESRHLLSVCLVEIVAHILPLCIFELSHFSTAISAKLEGGGPYPTGDSNDFKASRIAGPPGDSMKSKAKAKADPTGQAASQKKSDQDLKAPEYGLAWVEVLRDIRRDPTGLKLSGRESFVKWESYLKTSVMMHPLVMEHLIGQVTCRKPEKDSQPSSNWNENLDRHLASTIASTLVGAPLISWIQENLQGCTGAS